MALKHSTMLELGTLAPELALVDPATAKLCTLQDFSGSPALLIAFLCNHCPYVLHILDGFVEFVRAYEPQALAVVAICSNDVAASPQDAPSAMARLAKERGFTFPYLFDETQRVAKACQAVCTPDFFLFDRERRLTYRGQFDGSRPGNKTPVTGADLRAAVDAVLRGASVPKPQTPSAGCSIKWQVENEPGWA